MNSRNPNIKLLIVEDDEDDYYLTRDLLERSKLLKFEIDWAPTAEQARQVLNENRHNVCLMDYQLGSEIGINLVREAIESGFSSPIIMLTAQENIGVEVEAANAGAADYLTKDNLTFEQLFRSIKYALSRSEIEAERLERQRAESANRSKTEFLASLSHEIRTPLTAIIGYTELLVNQHERSNPDLTGKLEVINRNSKHLLSLLNDTLDLSKIEAGKLEIDKADIDTEVFLTDIFSLAQALAQEKKLVFRTAIKTQLPETIQTDAIRLRQILLNLLGNAFKFTEHGHVALNVSMIQTSTGKNALQFEVVDTGKGIKNSELKNIFNPFVQNNYNLYTHGSGLGLTISQKLAENLGGRIQVESEFGTGSTFTLTIDPGSGASPNFKSLNLNQSVLSFSKEDFLEITGKVLIVDDVADIRGLLGTIMDGVGLDYDFCTTGKEAIDHIQGSKQGEYSLILMDLGMPEMDGYQAIEILRKDNVDIPTIALTAASMQGEREKCLAAGFNAYIPKPVSAVTLLSAISKVMKSSQGSRGKAPLKAPGPGADGKTGDATSIRILVIEDNADANQTICELLNLLGYQCTGVLNTEDARRFLESQTPDVILSDINLGGEKCDDFMREVHEQNPDLRLCLMSGEEGIDKESLPAYISGYLKKPILLENLNKVIRASLASGD